MKSIYNGHGQTLPTITASNAAMLDNFDDRRNLLITDALLSACFAMVIALSVAMLVGLYCWSRHAPIFQDATAQAAITETAH